MGAESTLHQARPKTPSRLSNCGEMVAESVLEQLEKELLLEGENDHLESRMQSPGGCTLLVGMKLNATCRDMLAWTIADLAKPGDHIVAFHVSSFPFHSVMTSREYEEHLEQLASTLRGFLTVYEGLCILKQIKLEVEILPGIQVKKVLVDFAKSYQTCKLILGSNKHFTVRRSKSLGRYCLRRLPFTSTVVVFQHGEIILNEKGQLSRPDIAKIGAGVIKTLRRSMKRFGRNRKPMNGRWCEGLESPPRPSEASQFTFRESIAYTEHSAELEKCYFSDSSLFHSDLMQELMPSPKLEARRADMFLLEDRDFMSTDSGSAASFEELLFPGWPLMHHTIGFDKVKPVLEVFFPDTTSVLASHRRSADAPNLAPRPFPRPSLDLRMPAASPTRRLPVDKAALSSGKPEKPRARSPLQRLSLDNLAPSAFQRCFVEKVKGARSPRSPMHRLFADKEPATAAATPAVTPAVNPAATPAASPVASRISPSQTSAIQNRQMSVVDWALQLPHRGERSQDYADLLGEIARDAFTAAAATGSSPQSGSDEPVQSNKKVTFSLDMTEEMSMTTADRRSSRQLVLAQRLDTLCLDGNSTTFPIEDLNAATSNFSASNVVGQGGGSEVYKGMMADGKLVAVKLLNCGAQAEAELENDVTINTSLSRHPHIVSLLGYCVDFSRLILVYNYLPEGNLEDRLHGLGITALTGDWLFVATGTKSPVLPWRVRYKAAIGIAKALDYLHHGTSRPVIHRDVKASNILLTADFESQLSDFGLAKWAPKKASHLLCDDILGTFGYLAPEYFMYGRVNNKTDVYAFGVVLLELITGRTPIDNTKPKGHENLVNWARPLLKDNNLSELVDSRLEGAYDVEQMKRLLLAASLCVRHSSQRRPQMSQVLQILCSNHSRLQPIRTRNNATSEREDSSSTDFEEGEMEIPDTATYNECALTDIKTHFALAMLGVDDNNMVIPRKSLDHRGIDRLHSSKYLEAYLEGRYISSSSLVK